MIPYTHAKEEQATPDFAARIIEALESVGGQQQHCFHASYVDVSIGGNVWGNAADGLPGDGSSAGTTSFGMPLSLGIVPCRSIWDAFGNRLAAVLLIS